MTSHGADISHVLHSLPFWSLVLNFTLLLIVFVRMGRKPLLSFLQSRRETIQASLNEAAQIKAEAEAKHAEYTERLKQLDHDLASLRAEMIKAGELERDRIIADAETKASRLRHEAQFIIDQRLKQLRVDLTKETAEAAIQAANSILQQETTPQDQQRLAQNYLENLSRISPQRKPL